MNRLRKITIKLAYQMVTLSSASPVIILTVLETGTIATRLLVYNLLTRPYSINASIELPT